MITRTKRKIVTFNHPFLLKGIDRTLPAGDYQVITDEELIERLSFPAYHRLSTMMLVPGEFHQASLIEMVTVDPVELQSAQDRDIATPQRPADALSPTKDVLNPSA
jgi:hypothetical protein